MPLRHPALCIPTLASKPPNGNEWVHEIKHDGYRVMVRRSGDRVRLITRRGYDWMARFPRIVEAAKRLRENGFTIDGEAVWCGDDGVADFAKPHSRASNNDVILYAFDLLEIGGEDIRALPLEARKKRLKKLIGKRKGDILFNEHLEGDGDTIFRHACELGLEGIVSKRRDLPYRLGRSSAWLKVKNPASPAMARVAEGGSRGKARRGSVHPDLDRHHTRKADRLLLD